MWGLRFDGDPAVGDADDNNGDSYPDLGVFHGTAVAGIAAAMTDNTEVLPPSPSSTSGPTSRRASHASWNERWPRTPASVSEAPARWAGPSRRGRALRCPTPRPIEKLNLWGGAAALLALLATVYWLVVPAGSLDVRASLYRAAAARNQLLATGASVRPGDRLFLELESSKEIHAYVLAQDDLGLPVVLFPAQTEIQNPLERGIHRLPGPIEGQEQSWVVPSTGQSEKISSEGTRS